MIRAGYNADSSDYGKTISGGLMAGDWMLRGIVATILGLILIVASFFV